MPFFVYNKLTSTLLFQGGQIEIAPHTWRKVSEYQLKNGIFDNAEAMHQIDIVEADQQPEDGPPLPKPIIITEQDLISLSGGMTEAELKAPTEKSGVEGETTAVEKTENKVEAAPAEEPVKKKAGKKPAETDPA